MHSQATHFAFSFRQEIYRDKAETLLHLQVRQERLQPDLVLLGTNERLDHLLDTSEMVLALEKSGEIFIYSFFETIDNGKKDEAIMMMDPSFVGDDQAKEMWRSNFASLDLIRVVRIIPEPEKKWHEGKALFEVTIFSRPDPGKGFFGWEEGFDTRWISLVRTGNSWKIAEIATGP